MKSNPLKIIAISLAFLFLSGLSLWATDGVQWETDWKTALKNAAQNKQPVLADFYTDWCPHCKRLDKETFIDKSLIDYFKKEKYVLIKINPEKDKDAENKFKVFCYPTMVIFKADGGEADRMLGFRDPAQLIKSLEDLKKGIGTLEYLLKQIEAYKPGDKSDAKFELMFQVINKFNARGEFAQSLAVTDKIVALDKDNALGKAAAAMFQRGYCYYKWKKLDKAVEALLLIPQTFPTSKEAPDALASAAYYAEKGGDLATTIKLLKQYIQAYPDAPYTPRALKKLKRLETN